MAQDKIEGLVGGESITKIKKMKKRSEELKKKNETCKR